MQEKRWKVCVVTGTRAEYGILRRILYKLRDDDELDLQLAVTGTHLSAKFGNTQMEIQNDGFNEYDRIPIPVENDDRFGMAVATGVAVEAFARYFAGKRPDILLVLGDRYEAFAAVTAAYILGVPAAHISGGDVTEGALDDGFRHCITKMSVLHFPGCQESADRLVQMGEQPSSVWHVGEPGVENCLATEFWPVEQLSEDLRFSLREKSYAVVTFHPVTQEQGREVAEVDALIAAMEAVPELAYIITAANADAGGTAINERWQMAAVNHEDWHLTASLGVVRYLSACKHAAMVIGNSSSGLVEIPALGVPTVNIGDRQKGRMLATSVLSCEPTREAIEAAMRRAMTEDFQAIARQSDTPFGKGQTSSEIHRILKAYLASGPHDSRKPFYDLPELSSWLAKERGT